MKHNIMKHTLAGVLAVLCAASCLPAAASAEGTFSLHALTAEAGTKTEAEPEAEPEFTYQKLSDGTFRISKYIGSSAEVVIPSEVDGVSVTAIARRAFSGCSEVTSVTIPEGITSIGDYAFEKCAALKSIDIPDSVASIGNKVFTKCASLESINVGADNENYSSFDGVLYDKDGAKLITCPNKKETIEFPETVTAIGANAFENCSELTAAEIPAAVTSIGDSCFANCSKLESITIPEGVTTINYCAFQGCSSLTKVDIPETVNIIASAAFQGCSSLTGIVIPERVNIINDAVFNGCSSLSDIVIPDGVVSIGNAVFNGCSSLSGIVIPDGVESIGDAAFSDCSSLSEISLPSAITTIGASAFQGCTSLTAINIPEGVKNINGEAFRGCTKLRSIGIPDTVKYISNGVFWECNDIQSVFYSGTEAQWKDISITNGNDSLKDSDIYYSRSLIKSPALTFENGEEAVKLEWEANEEADKYAVCIQNEEGKWQIIAKTTDTSLIAKGLKGGTEYKMAVIAQFDGVWNMDFSNYIIANPAEKVIPKYPTVTDIEYNEKYHQFKIKWTAVPDAQNYGIAVYLAGKWKIQTQAIPGTTTTFTSPKLTAGKSYQMVIAAKVDGSWDLNRLNSRAFTVTVK